MGSPTRDSIPGPGVTAWAGGRRSAAEPPAPLRLFHYQPVRGRIPAFLGLELRVAEASVPGRARETSTGRCHSARHRGQLTALVFATRCGPLLADREGQG